jgi:hypothetical protein
MESAPETVNYRKHRLEVWTRIQKRYDDYVAGALKHGATREQAEAAAGRDIRGEVRWLIGELLSHTQGEFAADFVMAAPREWGARAEILLDADPIVPKLIAHTYPVSTWAAKLDTLTKQVAADDAAWQAWVARMLPVLQPFGLPSGAMNTLFGIADNVGQGIGSVGQGIGDAAGSLGRAFEYLPLALGVVGVGATAVALSILLRPR